MLFFCGWCVVDLRTDPLQSFGLFFCVLLSRSDLLISTEFEKYIAKLPITLVQSSGKPAVKREFGCSGLNKWTVTTETEGKHPFPCCRCLSQVCHCGSCSRRTSSCQQREHAQWVFCSGPWISSIILREDPITWQPKVLDSKLLILKKRKNRINE